MAAGRPLTDHDRQRVAELHAQGMSRNDIARQIKRSPSTVTKLARELGLAFDRAATRAATAAKVADAKARRADLALKLLDLAHEEADAFRQPCTQASPCTPVSATTPKIAAYRPRMANTGPFTRR